MKTDELERQLRGALRETLDRELGPDPAWAESPAAVRVAQLDRSRRRWPLRVLAIAALIGAGGGAALLAGTLRPPDVSAEPANGWIAFTVEQADPAGVDPDLDIWFVALGQEPRRVIGTDTDSVDQLCPAFSPDGRSLAYGSVDGAGDNPEDAAWRAAYRNAALVVADVADDGTVADRLTIDVGDGLPPPCPVWSPDGDQLAFGVPRTSPINPAGSGEGSEVWVVRLADRGVSVVPDLLATDLDWSPDGSLLAIVGGVETASGLGVRDGLQDARIHLYDTASGDLRSLDSTLGASGLTWSPDGGRIAYAGGEGPADDGLRGVLRIIDVETGRQEVITPAFDAIHGIGPVWSPDGETIVYQRVITTGERHEVVMVTPGDRSEETGLAREVVIPPFRTTPDGSGLELFPWRVTWSPDSKYLLYVAWSDVAETPIAAVPTDPNAPSVLLADVDGMVVYDGYDDTTRVPFQIWGRDPFPSSPPGVSPSASPSPSSTAPASASPTAPAGASPTVDVIGDWLDTSRWTTYVSERYQFTIGHPATWTVIESTHTWDQETDSINWDSGALEVFVPPDNTIEIYLAAWSVDVDPATTLAEWVQAFCDQYVASCSDIEGMSEPAFANAGDREGILFSWDDGMAAFFPTWYDEAEPGSIWDQPAPTDGRIYIVESGRPDSGPYYSRELIEAFSASLCVGCED
jgi:Tol biopolymer transport system component